MNRCHAGSEWIVILLLLPTVIIGDSAGGYFTRAFVLMLLLAFAQCSFVALDN